jgi:hypothetical protein
MSSTNNDTTTAIGNNSNSSNINSNNAYDNVLDNYMKVRDKLEHNPKFSKNKFQTLDAHTTARCQSSKLFSGNPALFQEAKREVNARIYELEHPSSESSFSTAQ